MGQELQKEWDELFAVVGQLDAVEAEFLKEQSALENKYNALRQPIYAARDAVTARIPKFWATAMENHTLIDETMSERDVELFDHLQELTVTVNGSVKTVSVTFTKNSILENDSLEKSYDFATGKLKTTALKWRKRTAEKTPSFFDWFENDDIEMFSVFVEDLYPNAVKYFLGESSDEESQESQDGEGSSAEDDSEDLEEE